MRGVVDVGEGAARLDPDGASGGIDPDPLEPAEVDDQTVVDRPEARSVVATAPDRDRQVEALPEPHGGAHVTGIDRLRDQRGSPVDPAVVDASRGLVVRVVRAR